MKKINKTVLLLCFFVLCLVLCGCQSLAAQDVDMKIQELSKKTVDLSIKSDIDEIRSLDSDLSEKEHNSLKYWTDFETIAAEYETMENNAVQNLESLISDLPPIEKIGMASEEQIAYTNDVFIKSEEYIRDKVSNKSTMEEAVAKIEKIKADCWVNCELCGGKGSITCRKCNGKGSRLAKYTADNGKVFDVYQECYRTETCYECHGGGGYYLENGEKYYIAEMKETTQSKPRKCKDCGKVASLSGGGYCSDCARKRMWRDSTDADVYWGY